MCSLTSSNISKETCCLFIFGTIVPCLMFLGYKSFRSQKDSLMRQKRLTRMLLYCLHLSFCLLSVESEGTFQLPPRFSLSYFIVSIFTTMLAVSVPSATVPASPCWTRRMVIHRPFMIFSHSPSCAAVFVRLWVSDAAVGNQEFVLASISESGKCQETKKKPKIQQESLNMFH